MGRLTRKFLLGLLAWVVVLAPTAMADNSRNSDVDVTVRTDGNDVHVTASFTVDATPQEVWAVLTDFDNMARFVSNLESSQTVGRVGNVVQVRQKGQASFGPLKFPFESLRELTLTPFERIQSRQLSGTLKKMEGVTEIVAGARATRINYRADSTSNQAIPPIVGPSFIKSETEEQFHEMQTEIVRRKFAAPKPRE